jgi:hypothetical protein
MPIIEQTSVSFKSAERIGSENRFLDGRTADPVVQVGLAPNNVEPFTGTRWLVRPTFSGPGVFLQCLGDVDGPRYLDGRTVDGTVGLAPDTKPPFTGTRWEVVDSGIDGTVHLFCRGDRTDGLNARFLAANSLTGTVRMAQDLSDATSWAIVDPQPDPVGGPGVTSARSTSSPSLALVDPGPVSIISMAYRGTDDRVSIMWGFIEDVFTASLAFKCIDRPALGIDQQAHKFYLAWTAFDQSINFMSSDDGLIFSGRTRLPGSSIFGPAITGANGAPVVLWTDAETGRLMIMNGLDGPVTSFPPDGPAETSSAAPAIGYFPDAEDEPLVVAWTGTNRARQLNVNAFGIKSTLDSSGPAAATSMSGPSIASYPVPGVRNLALAWTGLPGGPDHDNHPNIIFSRDYRSFGDRETFAAVSDVAPAIVNTSPGGDNGVLIAWADRQSQINLASSADLPRIPA